MSPEDKQKCIDYLAEKIANPLDNRTWVQVEKDLNISTSVLYRLRIENLEQIYSLADKKRSKYKSVLRSEAYKALQNRLEKSDNAIKLAFQLLGDLVERTESRVEHLTPEQKREKLASLLATVTNTPKSNKNDQEEKSGIQAQEK